MIEAHPYEEVAYDLYSLNNDLATQGLGRVGKLDKAVSLKDLIQKVKVALELDSVRFVGEENLIVSTVAVCGGAGGSLVRNAVAAGAQVLITGDVKYHEALEARDLGLAIIDAGHFATERPVIDMVAAYLTNCADKNGWDVTIKANKLSKELFNMC
jgi:putative NIF3 family GTP cyclohydrolase 1 type 2